MTDNDEHSDQRGQTDDERRLSEKQRGHGQSDGGKDGSQRDVTRGIKRGRPHGTGDEGSVGHQHQKPARRGGDALAATEFSETGITVADEGTD